MRDLPKATFAFLCAAVLLTLVTGLYGWSKVYLPAPNRGFGDAFYHTLLAFTGDGSYLAANDGSTHNVWIRIARISGLTATLSAIASVVVSVMGHNLLRWWARRQRNHSVIIGASPFALDMVPKDRTLVVFDTVEWLDAIKDIPRKGRFLLLSDPMTDFIATERVLGTPKEVIFGNADTVTNVERARYWLRRRPKRAENLKIRIEDSTVARDLHLLSPEFAGATLISRSDTVARALVTSMAPTALAELRGHDRVHVALIGMGSVNLAVAEELALRCHHHAQGPLRVTIVDRDIVAAETRIRAERPDLMNPDFGADDFSLDFLQMNALECCAADMVDKIRGIETDHPLTALVVAAGDNARNLAIAMRLRQLQIEKLCLKAPVFMRTDSQGSVAAAPFDDLTGGIVPFGGRQLDAEDLKLEALYEDLARGIHDRWRASPGVVRTPANDWDNMSSADRRASYRAAMSAVELYYAAGFNPPTRTHLAGLRLAPAAGNTALGNDALIAKLARTEKERWNTERRLEGYVAARGAPRDNEKKRHHLILPYEELLALDKPEEVRKDIDIVRAALHHGIASAEAASEEPSWRKRLCIGVIGPLSVDNTAVGAGVERILQDICTADPGMSHRTLDILTPNAPGFDRIAAKSLAMAWTTRTGRFCRIILFNAAQPTVMDEIALDHVARGIEDDATRTAIADRFKAERDTLMALAETGYEVLGIDMRGLGVSDKDLLTDRSAYRETLARVQTRVLDLADEMIFDTAGGSAGWTLRAQEAWEAKRGLPGHVF
ncbi:MAG: hypothetical protein AAFZ99_09985 [Pseudomonadota bacterium]